MVLKICDSQIANFSLLRVNLETKCIVCAKLIRFWCLFWDIVRFCILNGSKVITQNVKFFHFRFSGICKKYLVKIFDLFMADFSLFPIILWTNCTENTKLITFRCLFWHVVRFCTSNGLKVMTKNVKLFNNLFSRFVKKAKGHSSRYCNKKLKFDVFYMVIGQKKCSKSGLWKFMGPVLLVNST